MIGELKRYNSISRVESAAAHAAVHGEALSGFLGGQLRGGRWVRELEDKWCETFGCKHAVACNSATSGLLAAAYAAGLKADEYFLCPALTMSATAAAPALLGAAPYFCDVDPVRFCLRCAGPMQRSPKAVFVTNLFGHPADLHGIRKLCDEFGWVMIEDNAQAPFAMDGDRYAGTIGHMGVFSLNVHKHIQCGEGGVIVTDDDSFATTIRRFINHSEMAGMGMGLNLRMTEVTAAIAFAQLVRGKGLVQQRIEIAEALLSAIGGIPGLRKPVVLYGCKHAFYTVPFVIADRRQEFVNGLRAEGVPIVEGYVDPLYRLPAFAPYARKCETAEKMHDTHLFYYENCAWDPTPHQIKLIGEAFQKVAEKVKP